MVAMPDGVKLATDLYFPADLREPLPVILISTPYNKNGESYVAGARRFAARGYVAAVQDVRGKFESEGDYIISAADTNDGSDTVDWLAAQSWSNGKVGTTGCSYAGENQVEMAKRRNGHQLAMNPQAASGALQYFASRRGGAFELAATSNWVVSHGAKVRPQVKPPAVDWRALWYSLPLKGMMTRAGMPPTDWDDFVTHHEGDPWWDTLGYVKSSDQFDVPALFVDSWYDCGVGATHSPLWKPQKSVAPIFRIGIGNQNHSEKIARGVIEQADIDVQCM